MTERLPFDTEPQLSAHGRAQMIEDIIEGERRRAPSLGERGASFALGSVYLGWAFSILLERFFGG